ncbi:MAG: hypothetical protein U0903_14630 [Planctomycetales bacterium]
MSRKLFGTAVLLLPLLALQTARAQDNGGQPALINPSAPAATYFDPRTYSITDSNPVQQTTAAAAQPAPAPMIQPVPAAPDGNYPILNAPLYPCPRPNIPPGVGTTVITNPALAPHEMLYPHKTTGLYGPFYHKTYRGWILTPLGVYKTEKRKLTGTTVEVNYKGHISPFALFFPPVGR